MKQLFAFLLLICFAACNEQSEPADDVFQPGVDSTNFLPGDTAKYPGVLNHTEIKELQAKPIAYGATTGPIVAEANFDKDSVNILQSLFWQYQLQLKPAPGYARITDSFAVTGRFSGRIEVNKSQAKIGGGIRSMWYLPNSQPIVNTYDQRVAFSFMAPTWCPVNKNNFLVAQQHIKTKSTLMTAYPVTAIWVSMGKLVFKHTFDTINYNDKTPPAIKEYIIGDFVAGKVYNCVLRANFRLDNTGFIELYVNGKLVVNQKGANFNREDGNIQAPCWNSIGLYAFAGLYYEKSVMYYDRILFGSPKATYTDFATYNSK